jgi:hypothetical protein
LSAQMRKIRFYQIAKLVYIEMKKIRKVKTNSKSYWIVGMKLTEIKVNESILNGGEEKYTT